MIGERLALNFIQRMSGIASRTAAIMASFAGTKCAVLDTRKTTPGLREFEKMAVRLGGGTNHRMGLYDMILVKDNHGLRGFHGAGVGERRRVHEG